jgi:hypothetical protein
MLVASSCGAKLVHPYLARPAAEGVTRQRTLADKGISWRADSQVTAKAGGRPMCGTASINSRV